MVTVVVIVAYVIIFMSFLGKITSWQERAHFLCAFNSWQNLKSGNDHDLDHWFSHCFSAPGCLSGGGSRSWGPGGSPTVRGPGIFALCLIREALLPFYISGVLHGSVWR